jgi:enoyl-CoA hydratase/carnithine racemase
VLTAEPVDAATALQWGLVNEVVPHDELLSRALELGTAISAWEAPTLAFAKRAIHQLAQPTWSASLEHGVLVSALTRRLT